MLSFLLKAFFAVTTTLFAGSGNTEALSETSNSNVKSAVLTSDINSPSKKDSLTATQTPIVVFKLINTTETIGKTEGKRPVKLSSLIHKFSLINNPQPDRRRTEKSKAG